MVTIILSVTSMVLGGEMDLGEKELCSIKYLKTKVVLLGKQSSVLNSSISGAAG